MDEDLRKKLLKIKRLAETGVAGERANAKMMLNRLIARYGLTVDDLDSDPKMTFRFSYQTKWERTILFQCYCKVLATNQIRWYKSPKRTKWVEFKLTIKQWKEIDRLYRAYRKAFKDEVEKLMESLVQAFLSKHNLWSGVDDGKDIEVLSDEETELILTLYDNLKDVELPFLRIAN